MNDKVRIAICERLRKLADDVESGNAIMLELSTFDHYNPCLIIEEGLYRHNLTGDIAIQFRIKGERSTVISTEALEGGLNDLG